MSVEPGQILIRDRGELTDVREALQELGIPFVDGNVEGSAPLPTHLLISFGQQAVQSLEMIGSHGQSHHFLHLVITDAASRSLTAMLRRQGCDMVAAAPINKTVLRLLVQRALFPGVQRRDSERVTIGEEIKIKTGLLGRSAILAELSLRGCGLITRQAIPLDSEVHLTMPSKLTGGGPLHLEGKVVGIQSGSKLKAKQHTLAVVFANMLIQDRRLIQNIMTHHGFGKTGAISTPPGTPIETAAKLPIQHDERRSERRYPFVGAVEGHGPGSNATLIGCDLSLGGMRVQPESDVQVGSWLHLAIYGDAGMHPILLAAEVVRDDGEKGLALSFSSVTDPIREQLQALIDCLDAHGHTPLSAGTVVSEILGTQGEMGLRERGREA